MNKLLPLALLGLLPCALHAQKAGDESPEDYRDFGSAATELTVTSTPETTQQIKVIGKDAIERRGAKDLATLLEEELDMSVTRYGGYGNQTELSLRGFDTERIAILIDGVPANSPRSGEFDVSQIDLASVERIEVIYGGSDTKYNVSGALGGVINIITVKKQPPGLHIGAAFSNTGYLPGPYNLRQGAGLGNPAYLDLLDMQTLSFFAGSGAERFSWKASLFAIRAGNHHPYRDDYGFARRKVSNEVLDGGGSAALVWNIGTTATLLSDTKLYYARKNFPVTMHAAGSALATDLQLSQNLLLNAPVAFREDLAAEASLTYQTTRTNYGVGIASADHYLTAINRWSCYPSRHSTIRAGLDWRFLYVNTESATETRPVKTGSQGGLYLTGEFAPAAKLLLIASLKGATDTRQAVLIPKAGLLWKAHHAFTLKNNYFRCFKFPDFDDLYYRSLDGVFAGNPQLKPEDGWGADLSAELTPHEHFSLSATVYGQWTEDSIHWIKSAGGRWSPENVGKAWFFGLDARPALTIPISRGSLHSLKLGASYQFQLSWLLSGTLSFANAYRIPYMPTHIIGASADLFWNSGSLLVSAHYESTRYADTLNQMPLAPYCIVHATLNQTITPHLTLFAACRNILNALYESFAGYSMPGLSLTIGVRTSLPLQAE